MQGKVLYQVKSRDNRVSVGGGGAAGLGTFDNLASARKSLAHHRKREPEACIIVGWWEWESIAADGSIIGAVRHEERAE